MRGVGPESWPDTVLAVREHSGGSREQEIHLWWSRCHGGRWACRGAARGPAWEGSEGPRASRVLSSPAEGSAMSKGLLSEPRFPPVQNA